MFEEGKPSNASETGRLAASMASSLVLYGVIGSGIIAATAAVKSAVQEEEIVQIEFSPPPPPEPIKEAPKPKPKRKKKKLKSPGARAKVQRDEMRQPDKISDEVLEESDDDLVESDDSGPVEGYLDGTEAGTGDGSAADGDDEGEVDRSARASIDFRPEPPEYPESARSERIQGLVLVRCVVTAGGKNKECRAIRGHELLRETALAYVAQFRMSPARSADGNRRKSTQVFPVRFAARNF